MSSAGYGGQIFGEKSEKKSPDPIVRIKSFTGQVFFRKLHQD